MRLPEVIIAIAGYGGEGETLFLSDLMRAVRGTGFPDAPPSILQTPEEFRRQGNLYRGLRRLPVDEEGPTSGLEEGVFRVYVSGGLVCLRKTHESETRYESWGWHSGIAGR